MNPNILQLLLFSTLLEGRDFDPRILCFLGLLGNFTGGTTPSPQWPPQSCQPSPCPPQPYPPAAPAPTAIPTPPQQTMPLDPLILFALFSRGGLGRRRYPDIRATTGPEPHTSK